MKNVTVYRVDYVRKTKVPIGSVMERRNAERGNNLIGLLRLARKSFATGPQEAIETVVDRPRAFFGRS
ncbi:MAG TPA: hypothetical protein VIS30_06015 [Candidatus Deferrimicrobiaceae bacterium]